MPTAPPFRYDMANPRLVRYLGWPEPLETPRGFREDLLEHAGQIVRLAGDVDLVFVGRSPESLYDLLVGLLGETSWRERVQLLHLSLCDRTPGRLRRHEPGALAQLWRHVESLRLTPPQILARDRPVAFVDLVFGGRTFGNVLKLLRFWSRGQLSSWRPVRDRLRFVCLVERGHRAYEPWSPRMSAWTTTLRPEQLRLLSLDTRLWRYLADHQPKTTPSFDSDAWVEGSAYRPPTEPERRRAARTAVQLRRWGGWRRRALAEALERSPGAERWRSRLVAELRESA